MAPEQVQRAVDAYFASLRSLDVAQYLAAVSPDAVVQDPVGTPTLTTHDARREFYNGIASLLTHLSVDPDHTYINGNQAAVKWTGHATSKGGKAILFDGIDVLTINDAGTVQTVMAYWDVGMMMAQV